MSGSCENVVRAEDLEAALLGGGSMGGGFGWRAV